MRPCEFPTYESFVGYRQATGKFEGRAEEARGYVSHEAEGRKDVASFVFVTGWSMVACTCIGTMWRIVSSVIMIETRSFSNIRSA